MGLFKKIGRGIGKLGSFVGKVAKGVQKGGLVGGALTAVDNLGGGKKAQTKAFSDPFKASATPASFTVGGITVTTEAEKRKKMFLIGGIVAVVLLVVGFIFKKRKR